MTDTRLEYLILISATIAVVIVLSYFIRRLLSVFIKKNSSVLGVSPTTFVFLKNSITVILFSFGLFFVFHQIPYFKSLGSVLFAGAGVFAAIIGFASQKAFSNIIGGIFILIFKPFRVGDTIEISGSRKGVVEEITLRHTIIKDYEFRRVVIPNAVISDETIVNSSLNDERIKKHIEFGISYDSDVDLAEQIIRSEIMKHANCIDNRSELEIENDDPIVVVRLVSLGDFAVTLKAYVWAMNNDDAVIMMFDVFKTVKKEFERQGVEIPFPYRTLVFKNEQNKLTSMQGEK